MPPLEGHSWRPAVDLNHLPREDRHHPLERLVAGVEARLLRVVVLVLANERVVCPHAQHVVSIVLGTAVEGEGVRRSVNGPPVVQGGLEGGLDLPVFDEVLDQRGEAARSVVHLLGW